MAASFALWVCAVWGSLMLVRLERSEYEDAEESSSPSKTFSNLRRCFNRLCRRSSTDIGARVSLLVPATGLPFWLKNSSLCLNNGDGARRCWWFALLPLLLRLQLSVDFDSLQELCCSFLALAERTLSSSWIISRRMVNTVSLASSVYSPSPGSKNDDFFSWSASASSSMLRKNAVIDSSISSRPSLTSRVDRCSSSDCRASSVSPMVLK
mmetsp:Transcript_4193/g.12014  ORF Transcript_4193/g.12014 Transcript_4193/m.12014 type:complete len:210 (+) Transcript_4193:258-887(+)